MTSIGPLRRTYYTSSRVALRRTTVPQTATCHPKPDMGADRFPSFQTARWSSSRYISRSVGPPYPRRRLAAQSVASQRRRYQRHSLLLPASPDCTPHDAFLKPPLGHLSELPVVLRSHLLMGKQPCRSLCCPTGAAELPELRCSARAAAIRQCYKLVDNGCSFIEEIDVPFLSVLHKLS